MFRKTLVVAMVMALGLTAWAEEGKGKKDEAKQVKRAEKAFKKVDKDGDGKLTLDEFKAARSKVPAERAEAQFKRMDTDSSGGLTLEEFKQGLAKARKEGEKDVPEDKEPQ